MHRLAPALLGLAVLSGLAACVPADSDSPDDPGALRPASHDPADAVAGLDVADDLEVTLFAAEPMVVNPTNMDIDARGRVWVNEGVNYRPHLNPNNPTVPEGDRIVILEDTDRDGRADERTVFYQGNEINAALGIAVLGNRVIVSASPNVFVFTDTDGDDRADEKEILFTGIGGEQHDHAVHAFVFGPDGRLYFNFGNAGKQLLDAEGRPVHDAQGNVVNDEGRPYREGMVFRMNPDGTDLHVLGHNFRNNYEVAVDAFGTLWQSDNDDDGNRATRINYVMPYGNYGFRDEMTGAGWRVRRTGMHEEIPLRHWHLNDPGVVPNLLQTGAGSPTGILVYEGRLLPERFHGEMIHADAGPNVVRAYPVESDGAGYRADIVNIVEGARDQWFRPSDVTAAPDGSLFIADWYDPGVGGHQMGDLDRGRIFRVAPPETPYTVPAFDLDTPEGAVDALTSPNVAARYLGWQALAEMDAAAEPALTQLWTSSDPRHRARALWLLARLDLHGPDFVAEALGDESPDIRITGLRAAEQQGLDLIEIVDQLKDDPSPQVRREAVIALRHHDAPEAADLWADYAMHYDGRDRWYLEALGIAADGQWDRFFPAWLERVGDPTETKAHRDIVWRARTAETLPLLGEMIADAKTGADERPRYFRAFDFHTDPAKQSLLAELVETDHPERDRIALLAMRHLDPAYVRARPALRSALTAALATADGTMDFVDLAERFELTDQASALANLALAHPDSSLGLEAAGLALDFGRADLFADALDTDDPALRRRVLMLLAAVGHDDAGALLHDVMTDAERPLEERRAALEGYGRGWRGESRLLAALEAGDVPDDLTEAAATRLQTSGREHIRQAAARFLDPSAADLPDVAALLDRTGDPASGRAVFTAQCSACHIVDGRGVAFGPDLSEIGTKLPEEALYTSILRPSEGIGFGYEGVLITLNDGSRSLGYVVSETEDALELRVPGGRTERFAKADIVEREMQDVSLMPPNLHRLMTEQELVDLVAYLQTLRRAPA